MFSNRDFKLLVVSSLAFFALVAAATGREYTADWRRIQAKFVHDLREHGDFPAASRFTVGIKQIWIPTLNRVDRCVSCHLNYDGAQSARKDLPKLFLPHPELPYLKAHPFPKFGCTLCHGGQGYALAVADAHGDVEHWEEPLLSTQRARAHGLKRQELMQYRCNVCHRRQPSTPGTELVDLGKKLVEERGCKGCHTIAGEGGKIGPDLTYEGDQNPEHLDFTHVKGPATDLMWQIAHLLDPPGIVSASAMPNLGLSPKEARAIALVLLSWKRTSYPAEYTPYLVKPPG